MQLFASPVGPQGIRCARLELPGRRFVVPRWNWEWPSSFERLAHGGRGIESGNVWRLPTTPDHDERQGETEKVELCRNETSPTMLPDRSASTAWFLQQVDQGLIELLLVLYKRGSVGVVAPKSPKTGKEEGPQLGPGAELFDLLTSSAFSSHETDVWPVWLRRDGFTSPQAKGDG